MVNFFSQLPSIFSSIIVLSLPAMLVGPGDDPDDGPGDDPNDDTGDDADDNTGDDTGDDTGCVREPVLEVSGTVEKT